MSKLVTFLSLVFFAILLTASCDRGAPLAPDAGEPALNTVAAVSSSATAVRATGSGHFTTADDVWRTFSFHAKVKTNGDVTGSFQLVAHRGGQKAGTYHGKVICLSVRDNQAWVGGYFTKMPNPDRVGTWMAFRAVDNGEGHGSPDQISRTRWAGQEPEGRDVVEAHCLNQPEDQALYDIEAGNVQVRG